MDRLVLVVMYVKRWSAVRRNLADEVVERALGVFACELEHELSAWAGLQARAFVCT